MGRSTGRSRHRHYDHAADMYSLGIVAFEVAHAPWDTAMERVVVLSNLQRHMLSLSCLRCMRAHVAKPAARTGRRT